MFQMVLLLRLLASCWSDGNVRVRELYCFAEDVILQSSESTMKQCLQLNQIRMVFLQYIRQLYEQTRK